MRQRIRERQHKFTCANSQNTDAKLNHIKQGQRIVYMRRKPFFKRIQNYLFFSTKYKHVSHLVHI